ncbi:MAG TPA: hypothetical protein VNN08_10150 [Thermoanaerobaculia bacterium]|nr:hypothetical protein [Thermoanaerobaculia bacterium]
MATNLKDLETRLNSDATLRSKFTKDPVKFLQGEGVTLTAAEGTQLKADVAKATTPAPIARGGTAARPIRISIGIRVIIDQGPPPNTA